VLQIYPENAPQLEMISAAALRSGFSGGLVVDYPHSTRAKKYFLCLMCGPPSTSTSLPKAKGLDRGSESESSSDADEEAGTVCSLCHSVAACFLICHPVSNLQLAQVVWLVIDSDTRSWRWQVHCIIVAIAGGYFGEKKAFQEAKR
jgi:hypothetical protein